MKYFVPFIAWLIGMNNIVLYAQWDDDTTNQGNSTGARDEQAIPESVMVNNDLMDIYHRLEADKAYHLSDSVKYYLSQQYTWEQISMRWYEYLRNNSLNSAEKQQPRTAKAMTKKDYPGLTGGDTHVAVRQKTKTINKGYYIQLLAHHKPLTQVTLQGLYYGDKDIKVNKENDNYIYTIGRFDTFQDAEDYKQAVDLSEGIILAYEHQQTETFHSVKNEAYEKTQPTNHSNNPPIPTENMLFFVQIVASKVPLTIDYIGEIYQGTKTIHVRNEDGWYKYQLGGSKYYHKAREILNNCGINTAFIAAYENGRLQNLVDAKEQAEQFNANTLPKDMQFAVQLAASKYPLSDKMIHRLYQGENTIRMVIEEGWYKYQIIAGKSYDDALRIRNATGIDGAFVVGYANGEKILLY